MSRRRAGGSSSRRDRYGIGDEEKIDETDAAAAPYQLATDEQVVTEVQAESVFQKLGKWAGFATSNDEQQPLSPRGGTSNNNNQDVFRDEPSGDEDDDDEDESLEGYDMTLQELMYSTSSFYAIVVPGTYFFTLIVPIIFSYAQFISLTDFYFSFCSFFLTSYYYYDPCGIDGCLC